MSIICLLLSVLFSVARNILSKCISDLSFGTKQFFQVQSLTFLTGSVVLLLFSLFSLHTVSPITLLYSILYGVFLLSAQYCYTIALNKGKIGICSTVYSFGFVLPTISGLLFWNETLTILNGSGILLVIPTILLSSSGSRTKNDTTTSSYILPLIAAMISSGALGILQKVQQISPYPDEKNFFIILSFAFAGITSFLISCVIKRDALTKINIKKLSFSGGIGIAFGCSNLLNTMLSGQFPVSIFTPILNTSTILFSLIVGMTFFHERLSKKDCLVLLLGVLSILFIALA